MSDGGSFVIVAALTPGDTNGGAAGVAVHADVTRATQVTRAAVQLIAGRPGKTEDMASRWRLCERCRKVKDVSEFPSADADDSTCTACLTRPARVRSVARTAAAPVIRREPVPVTGRGDREARAARARATAQRRLGEQHAQELQTLIVSMRGEGRGRGAALVELSERNPDDYERLLTEARREEGLEDGSR